MTIRRDMDEAFARRQRLPKPDVRRTRAVWRMGRSARSGLSALLAPGGKPVESYLNIPIVETDEIVGFELAEVPA